MKRDRTLVRYEDTCKMTVGLICNENVELYHEQGERGAGGVERPPVLVREQLHGRGLYTGTRRPGRRWRCRAASTATLRR